MVLSKLAQEVSTTLVSTIKGTSDVISALRGVVKEQVTGVLKDVSDMATASLDAVSEVVGGAVSATGQVGASVGEMAKAAVSSAISTVSELGGNGLTAVSEATSGAVSGAASNTRVPNTSIAITPKTRILDMSILYENKKKKQSAPGRNRTLVNGLRVRSFTTKLQGRESKY